MFLVKKHSIRFLGQKTHFLVDFTPAGATGNAAAYCDTLTRFNEPFETDGGEFQVACAYSTTTLGPIPHTSPLRFLKNLSGMYWTILRTVRTSRPAISTCFFT
jgi:hypothetical protein